VSPMTVVRRGKAESGRPSSVLAASQATAILALLDAQEEVTT
jgi:hypothetical protein